jgi:hypothetical protein
MMSDEVFINQKLKFRVIYGDSSDRQGCEALCFLKEDGRFDTYWDIITDLLDIGGWDEDESAFIMTYGKITFDYVNRKGKACQKVYEGEFYMSDSELYFEKGSEKNTHKFLSSLIGLEVKAHFQFALNEEIFKISIEKDNMEKQVKPTKEEKSVKKGMKL